MMIQRILLNGGLLLFFSKAGQQLLRLLAALLICVAMRARCSWLVAVCVCMHSVAIMEGHGI